MAVQLQITLPVDWASDFDRVAERWYFFHRPSGFCQYLLPKTGDEITRAAALVPILPPRPVKSEITTKMGAMSIVKDKEQSVAIAVVIQQTQSAEPISNATQILQRTASVPQQTQQGPLSSGDVLQKNIPAAIPNGTFGRRTSGPVERKPLPRQNSAPQQQQPQAPVLQGQDSQISPRSSISQTSITQSTIQPVQQYPMQSPRSSVSQTSMAESPLEQTHQQAVLRPQNSLSQTSITFQPHQAQQHAIPNPTVVSQAPAAEPHIQLINPQSMPTTNISSQNQVQTPNNAVHTSRQATNPQYNSVVVQSPDPTSIQDWTSGQIESGPKSAPTENPAVFWSDEFAETPRSPAQSHTWARSSRPKLANRLSSSAIKMPKKAYEASKDYLKEHPGRTTAIAGSIIGGIGLVGEACGASGLSEAAAASKIYLNVQRANQRKKKPHNLPQTTAQHTTPGVAQSDAHTTSGNGPSAKEVAEELFKMMKQQGQLPSLGQNAAPQNNQNNNSQPPNQGVPPNPQYPPQQYFPPQYTQPQVIYQQPLVQPDLSGASLPYVVPPLQINQVQTPPPADPSTAAYQPPPSPILPDPSQCPAPPLSFSGPSSQPPSIFDTSTISPDPSAVQYDNSLQNLATNTIANQALLGSQTFTTNLTGQNMFIPGDYNVGQSDACSLTDMPLEVGDANADVAADWTGENFSSGDDDNFGAEDYDSC